MIVLLSIILALILLFSNDAILFINTRLHENVNHSKEEIRHEKSERLNVLYISLY